MSCYVLEFSRHRQPAVDTREQTTQVCLILRSILPQKIKFGKSTKEWPAHKLTQAPPILTSTKLPDVMSRKQSCVKSLGCGVGFSRVAVGFVTTLENHASQGAKKSALHLARRTKKRNESSTDICLDCLARKTHSRDEARLTRRVSNARATPLKIEPRTRTHTHTHAHRRTSHVRRAGTCTPQAKKKKVVQLLDTPNRNRTSNSENRRAPLRPPSPVHPSRLRPATPFPANSFRRVTCPGLEPGISSSGG